MNTIYNTYKASEEGFEETFLKDFILSDTCRDWKPNEEPTHWHANNEKQMQWVKSFNRTSALALLASVRGMIEGEKGKCKAHTFYEGLCYECSDKKERNNVVQNLLSSIKLAEQQIQQ
jgi:hypothetical protein